MQNLFIKTTHKLIIFTVATTLLMSSVFISPAKAEEEIDLKNYLTYFYNRYSIHLDEWGLVYKAPGYGVPNFKRAESAREILSLAAYYKYRALSGEKKARTKIRVAILNAVYELNSRSIYNHSFSDAWAQMVIISLIDQMPNILTQTEKDKIYSEIADRIESGILIEDSSNRAALSAVYWQQIINNLYAKQLISFEDKEKYDKLVYKKIISIIGSDITQDGWYIEGRPKKFNPHYHMVTATALASYAEITGDIETYILAKKMIKNLHSIAFKNGMVEARIGLRPIGLGAQFYLGAGILSYKFGHPHYSAYLNYAYGDRFFSDSKYPDRLEYHSTIYNSSPDYHDDISFSNLAELILLTSSLTDIKINLADTQLITADDIVNYQDLEISQINNNYTIIKKIAGNQKLIAANQQSVINIAGTYGQERLLTEMESQKVKEFLFQVKLYYINQHDKNILASAYIYGGYTIQEIMDTIKNGPRAVHPTIPSIVWQGSQNYQGYLDSVNNK